MAPDQLFELRRRTFDTPTFRGIEFIEVEAKTILNPVPGNYLPFNWTINPYRGCSHSCSYCVSGDTPILMADGRTKPLRDVRTGDRIYGTKVEGNRRYVTTEVLDHWSTNRPAYRVTLEDGTRLVSSGDHRFLTDRGWRYVAPAEKPAQRPFLTLNNKMMGVGTFAPPPETFEGMAVTSGTRLGVVAIEDLGLEMPMFDMTTGTGDFIADGVVSHNCFARATHTFLDMNAGKDFETKIVVKVNAPEVLRRQLRAKRWKGELIAMGTNTDPYQRCEGRYKLTRQIIETLAEFRNPFSILTKGTLIMRDLDLLKAAAEVTEVSTALSIPTLDEEVWRRSEPGTPHPRKRVEAVAKLNGAGIPCGVLVAPVLPGISDSEVQLREVITACIDAGATHVSPMLLHLRPKVREVYMEWLGENYPDLVESYQKLYPRAYASPQAKGALQATTGDIMRGHHRRPPIRRRRPVRPPELTRQLATLQNEQLKLL